MFRDKSCDSDSLEDMKRELFVLVCASAIALGATASVATGCSSSSTTATNTGTDSGVTTHPATDDSGATGDTDSGSTGDQDSGTVADGGFNGCTSYVDDTAKTEVDITWGLPYTAPDKCAKIKVGTVVKYTGDFSAHPLEKAGGDSPSPYDTIPSPDAGSISITFPNAGTFGYNCMNHMEIMVGAFVVVP
jgi:plastocyanin